MKIMLSPSLQTNITLQLKPKPKPKIVPLILFLLQLSTRFLTILWNLVILNLFPRKKCKLYKFPPQSHFQSVPSSIGVPGFYLPVLPTTNAFQPQTWVWKPTQSNWKVRARAASTNQGVVSISKTFGPNICNSNDCVYIDVVVNFYDSLQIQNHVDILDQPLVDDGMVTPPHES